MKDLESLIESLLWQNEGTALDFKSKQYPFSRATTAQKAELLKDVLAFTNSWRQTDAYILLGVQESAGSRSQVVGVSEHLEDASLQQFINEKTQRPVELSYLSTTYDSHSVGLICIPLQERPVYLLKDYGPLSKEVVYVRRGSSTAEARPDEIARMGMEAASATSRSPLLSVALASSRFKDPERRRCRICVRHLTIPPPASIPEYQGGKSRLAAMETPNPSYFRELSGYVKAVERSVGFHIIASNDGSGIANDVRLELEADRATGLRLWDSTSLPRTPHQTRFPYLIPHVPAISEVSRDLWVSRLGDRFSVSAHFGKLQSGTKSRTANRLLVGATESGRHQVHARLFCDELSQPVETELDIGVEVVKEEVDLERIIQLDSERLFESDSYREYRESFEER